MAEPYRKTKIIATVGPSVQHPRKILSLLKNGVNVFRLNFSHGDHAAHRRSVSIIRESSEKLGITVGILADLQGPKIRTGNTYHDLPVKLKTGAHVILLSGTGTVSGYCTESQITISYPTLAQEIRPRQIIVINDGAILLEVTRIEQKKEKQKFGKIHCIVLSGGVYASKKGVNLPNVRLRIPSMTNKDLADLKFILTLDIQYIALSFVRNASDIIALRKLTKKKRPDIKLIAKIEKPEAAGAIDDILQAADGIMAARGDLGVEAPPNEIPILQKNIIRRAEVFRKPVIVATQMLESMITNALPTRAETTDVANAIFDGADAVMLSGETAVGAHPEKAVKMMSEIAVSAERSIYIRNNLMRSRIGSTDIEREAVIAVCESAAWASAELSDIPICVFTLSGDTVIILSKMRTTAPIFAFSPDIRVVNLLSLAYNVRAFHIIFKQHIADLAEEAEKILIKNKYISRGSRIILIFGTSPVRGAANIMQIKKTR